MGQISRTRQFFYLVFGGGLSQASGLLVTIILARKLSEYDFGTYRQLLLICTLVVPLFSSAIPNSLLYFIPRIGSHEGKKAFVRRTVLILAGLGLLTSLVLIAAAGEVAAQFSNPSIERYLFLMGIYPALLLSSSYIVPFLIAIGQARASAVYSSITSFVNLVFVGGASFFYAGLAPVVIATVSGALFSIVLAFYISGRQIDIFRGVARQEVPLKEQIAYAIPLGLASAVSIWGRKIDQVVISSYFDVETFAIYSVGAMELPLVGLISSSIYSVLFPEISRLMGEGRKDELLNLWKRTVERSMLIIMPLFGVVMILSDQIITVLYTEKYAGSVPIFQMYLFLIPLRTISFGLLLRAAGKTKYDFYGSILFIAVNTAAALLTVKPLGVYGPTISLVLSVYVLAFYQLYNIKKEYGFGYSETLNLKAVYTVLGITIAPGLLYLFFIQSLHVKSMLVPISALVVYSVFITFTYSYLKKWSRLQLRKS